VLFKRHHLSIIENNEKNSIVPLIHDVRSSSSEPGSSTHKKEYVQWIEEAKKQETREKRIQKAIEMIAEGRKRS